MKSTVRKIGNSRGVLIPASFLAACEIENEIELRLDGSRIIIEPIHTPRRGWFDGYETESGEDAWPNTVETDEENEDWQW